MTPNPQGITSLTLNQARGLNRAERRRLGKANGIKIAGTTKPIINPVKPKNQYESK